jgi:NADP-dependent 3-hydroxy acid dehydrogenase YdfG
VFDVTDHAAACVAEDEYEATPGPIDILVNSAGTTRQPQTGR